MSFIQRIPRYILILIPSLGILINTLQEERFNVDEYQHTHLAWMATHLGKLQYKEIWDNHGPIYTIVNSIFITIFNLGANVGTYIAERYLNLIILIIGFVVLFELFRTLTGKWYYAALGPWFFAGTFFSQHAIQVRPDNLQCLFLYLALLLLVKAFKQGQKQLAFYSGLSLALMLMTNLKSLTGLAAITVSLALLFFLDRESKALTYLKSMYQGLSIILFIVFGAMILGGFMEGYIQDNIVFNIVSMGNISERALRTVKNIYFNQHHLLSVLILVSIAFWTYQCFKLKKIDYAKFITLITVVLMGLSRLKVHLWTQYDLLFIPLFCFIASSVVLELSERLVFNKINSKIIKSTILVLIFTGFSYSSGKQVLTKKNMVISKYHDHINQRINKTAELLGENGQIENCHNNAPELGFFETASRRILQISHLTQLHQKANPSIANAENYIDLLQKENVKVILANHEIFMHCNYSTEFRKYIIRNYFRYDPHHWLRRDCKPDEQNQSQQEA